MASTRYRDFSPIHPGELVTPACDRTLIEV
jgi:hypothetical protein